MDLKFAKARRAAVDFDEWDLSDASSMMDAALKSAVGAALDVVFSESGAEIELHALPCESDSGNVVLSVKFDLGSDLGAYATTTAPLKDVLLESARGAPKGFAKAIASGLREIAEEIERAVQAID